MYQWWLMKLFNPPKKMIFPPNCGCDSSSVHTTDQIRFLVTPASHPGDPRRQTYASPVGGAPKEIRYLALLTDFHEAVVLGVAKQTGAAPERTHGPH